MDPVSVSIDFTELQDTTKRTTKAGIEKLIDQVKRINIDNANTLFGVVGLIFEKALTETSSAEMYANLCSRLAVELPGFGDDNEKITFKRLLLNKCQKEFERGGRKEEEANRTKEEGETKETKEEQEENRVKARRRMLGNIRLIGELYKKRVLTERIMHECIRNLLGLNQKNILPREENIEALCELMSAIGWMIDHPKAKKHMDIYFDTMFQLSNDMALSSQVRFMLKDAVDVRKNKWLLRPLISILNNLTPQNFEKLFDQVKQVNIDNADTLSVVVGLIFEKALMEPTFVEMYANLCSRLAVELPGFGDDNKKITFKRLLLNKCQEEFERGEREEQEANRTAEEGDIKETKEEHEEKRVKARRRMLGNIRLLGELYKKRMLTERIMHECIRKLLDFNQKNIIPREEDIEALCKLMKTIGVMIDHPRAKKNMDAYFDMMFQLSNNMALSSRVRFMLKDAFDLRKNKWLPRQLVSIVNKLTLQNFEKLFDDVKQVNIDNVDALSFVIDQIFDKAVMEPTFVEMYANFCFRLGVELPGFKQIIFKRLLVNKCREEFERGRREEEEEEEGEDEEEERVKARRRMLGIIRLIVELYKKRMLTAKIMHECIKKLLGFIQNPNSDEENIEALCKLMSATGERIDHPKAKEYMDAYFDMMFKLSINMTLPSQVRFMLKDVIDLRKNKWQQRRKVEGPKKMEEVHRDAAQERLAQSSRLAGGPSSNPSLVRGGQPLDFAPKR